jgi:putative redox protein
LGQATVTWLQGEQFVGTDSTNHSTVISSGKAGVGMKPSELLLVSLASCTAYDVVNILTKKRAGLTHLHVTASGEQAEEPPWSFQKIHVHYAVRGRNLKPADVEKAVELSEEKYCSVSATLRKAVELTYDIEILEEED